LRFCPGRMLKIWINCEIWKRNEAGTAWISEWEIEDFWLLPFSLRQMPHGCRCAVAWDVWIISVQLRENGDIRSCRLSLRLAYHAWCESITNSTLSNHDDVTNNTINSPWTLKITLLETTLHSTTALGDYLESVLNSKQNYLPRSEKRVCPRTIALDRSALITIIVPWP
jgi:hypothetical protein